MCLVSTSVATLCKNGGRIVPAVLRGEEEKIQCDNRYITLATCLINYPENYDAALITNSTSLTDNCLLSNVRDMEPSQRPRSCLCQSQKHQNWESGSHVCALAHQSAVQTTKTEYQQSTFLNGTSPHCRLFSAVQCRGHIIIANKTVKRYIIKQHQHAYEHRCRMVVLALDTTVMCIN